MRVRVRLGVGAQRDVQDAVAWYEEKQQGLGERFLEALDDLFERIVDNPQQFPAVERGVRRALLRRFPYGVYFVIAILHFRRYPKEWSRRI